MWFKYNKSKYFAQKLLYLGKSKFFSEGMFSYRGFSLLQSEHPLFLHFPGLFFKILFVKVEAF